MKSTQLKVSKNWNSIMSGLKLQGKNGLFTPPMCSHLYNLKTVQQSNDKGTWFGWSVSKIGPIEDRPFTSKQRVLQRVLKKVLSKRNMVKKRTGNKVPFKVPGKTGAGWEY